MGWRLGPLAGAAVLGAMVALPATAQMLSETVRFTLGAEQTRLPGGEAMGLVGATLLFDVADESWWLGPAVYGAATGQRGGFYVGGIEVQRTVRLGRSTALAAGLFAGGGGGAAAPVGGGLMLRPALTLWQDFGPLQAGLSWSHVRFPSGEIASSQVGLLLGWTQDFRHVAPGVAPQGTTGLGFDRMGLTATQLDVRTDGADRQVRLVGVRADRDLDTPGLVAGVEAAAAVHGNAAGYMEILGDLGWDVAPLPAAVPSLRVGVRGALGLGGGGDMPMGGGAFGKLTLTGSVRPFAGWTLGADVGVVRGDPLRARMAQFWLAADLEPPRGAPPAPRRPVRTEWAASLQQHTAVARNDGTTAPLTTIGLELNRYLGQHLYLSGQAHSAFAGGAGAYSIGLVGVGWATSADRPWRLGGELLAGSAGGGGVLTGGGGVGQARLWAGWSPVPAQEWRLSLAGLRSGDGALSTPVVGLAWSRCFGQ